MLVLLTALAVASAPPAGNLTLHLICAGTGEHNVRGTSSALVRNSNGNWATGTMSSRSRMDFNDTLSVDIDGSDSRIRLPRRMLPPMHGGKDGWMELADVKVSDTEITGTAHVNFANHPKVRIDRMAGTISVDGRVGSFAGRCEPYDPATTQRAF